MAQSEEFIFPGWEVTRKLGEGSFGGVYEIRRTLPGGRVEKCALKRLTVPRDSEEIRELYAQSFSKDSITAHYKGRMEELVNEYGIMQSLSGCPNIVNCHDIQYVQHDDGIGWDIYIRMELLYPLKKVLGSSYSEDMVCNLGIQLCNALTACHGENIIHRDIKPENILVSGKGAFKLGDFGIAKVSEKTGTGTMTGTYGYMAPEVANRQHYGASVDIYSLGMVLYWMMNKRTLPFLPLPPSIPTGAQRQQAQERRLSGEPLPPPTHGSAELKAIVLKACAYAQEERFHSAREMYEALCHCSRIPVSQEQSHTPAQPAPGDAQKPVAASPDAQISDEPTQYDTVGALGNIPVKSEAVCSSKPAQATAPAEGRKAKNSASRKNDFHKWLWLPACLLLLCGVFGIKQVIDASPASKYRAAQERLEAKDYSGAAEAFEALGNYADSASKVQELRQMQQQMEADYQAAQALMDDGKYMQAMWAFQALDYQDSQEKMQEARDCFIASQRTSLSAGANHTVGLRRDGTAVAAGVNYSGQCDIGSWTNIVAVSAGDAHTVGLRADGIVVATGANGSGQCNVDGWTNIVAISAGGSHTVGLRADGTVVAMGENGSGQCNVGSWTDIVAISAGGSHTVGLRADGTVVTAGTNGSGQCNVYSWTNIVAISAGDSHTVGLRADGTVWAAGANGSGRCNVGSWTNIVAIGAGHEHTMGLRSDGTVVAVGWNIGNQCGEANAWKDIVEVGSGRYYIVGLRSDGTVVATGAYQQTISKWTDIATTH